MDYYEIFGIQNDATPEEIKKAYRERILQNHPDKNGNDSQATERTKEIIEAYIDNPSDTRNPFTTVISSNSRPNHAGQTPLKMAIIKSQEDSNFWNVVARLIQRPEVIPNQVDMQVIYQSANLPQEIDSIVGQKLQILNELASNRQNNCVIS